MKLPNWLRSAWNWIVRYKFYVGAIAAVAVLSAVVWGWEWLRWVWCWCWDWLGAVSEGKESRSTTLRNIGLLVGGGIAIWVAYRRSVISQRVLLNERYQRGAEMLGSEVLAVRLGGIYALEGLSEEEPELYHVPIVRVLSTFARNSRVTTVFCEDVHEAVRAIGNRSATDIELETKACFAMMLSPSLTKKRPILGILPPF